MGSRRLWLAAMVAFAVPAAAHGDDAEKRAREVRSGWVVVPILPSTAPVTVAKGGFALKQRLLPIGTVTTDADALDADGKPLVPAGTPLMRLMGRGYIACVFGERPRTGLGNFWMGFKGGDSRICLRDTDSDGRFEEFVRYSGGLVQGLPSVNGHLPKALHALKQPVGYTVGNPATMPTEYFLAIRYDGHAALGGHPVFVNAFGQGKDVGTLIHAWPREDDGKGKLAQTGTVRLDGAVLVVTQDAPDGVTLVVKAPFPTGVFSVSQVGQNGFH